MYYSNSKPTQTNHHHLGSNISLRTIDILPNFHHPTLLPTQDQQFELPNLQLTSIISGPHLTYCIYYIHRAFQSYSATSPSDPIDTVHIFSIQPLFLTKKYSLYQQHDYLATFHQPQPCPQGIIIHHHYYPMLYLEPDQLADIKFIIIMPICAPSTRNLLDSSIQFPLIQYRPLSHHS